MRVNWRKSSTGLFATDKPGLYEGDVISTVIMKGVPHFVVSLDDKTFEWVDVRECEFQPTTIGF
jgi:hypothetical protein